MIKVTLFFQLGTNVSDPTAPFRRLGGWSESWYYNSNSLADTIFAVNSAGGVGGIGQGICAARAALLPIGASIVGQRFQVVDPLGSSQSTNKIFAGTNGLQADVPSMALLVKVPGAGVKNVRRTILRGIPDARVVEGEYSPSVAFTRALNNFFFTLGRFNFRGKDLTQVKHPLASIAANGDFVTNDAAALPINSLVQVSRAQTSDGVFRNGIFYVQTAEVPPLPGRLRNWKGGDVTGGTITRVVYTYPQVDPTQITVGRIIQRKVGRPFAQYVGRRSKRR